MFYSDRFQISNCTVKLGFKYTYMHQHIFQLINLEHRNPDEILSKNYFIFIFTFHLKPVAKLGIFLGGGGKSQTPAPPLRKFLDSPVHVHSLLCANIHP